MGADSRLRRVLAPLARGRDLVADLSRAERIVLAAVAVMHVVAITWGLPSSEGWDVDGIAPRDFLPGVVKTFTPGDYFTYPPLHLIFLTVLTLPVTLVQLFRAPSFAPADVVATFLSVPVMTIFSIVARVMSCLMSLGVVLVVGRIAKTIFGTPTARAWAMAIAGFEVAGTYYAHTTNLDLPALFWGSLALVTLVQALVDDAPRRLRRVGLFAAMAIATKDQAYAVFALTMPVTLLAWLAVTPAAGRKKLVVESLLCAAIAIGLVLLLDGALFNPTGFAARLRFLTGPASQDYAMQSNDTAGRIAVLVDAIAFFPNHYPLLLAPLLALGIAVAVARHRGRERIAALVPLLVVFSFTFAFNCVARRVEERFMLPQMQLLAVYGGGIGYGVDQLLARRRKALASTLGAVGALAVVLQLRLAAAVVATMIGDARYDAEAYLRANAKHEQVIEVYGNNVYLPRFDDGQAVQRVDPKPLRSRARVPGIDEKQDLLGNVEERKPTWIVIGMGYAWRYLQDGSTPADGHVLPTTQKMNLADEDSRDYFHALVADATKYEMIHVSRCTTPPFLPPRSIHASLATPVLIFRRREAP